MVNLLFLQSVVWENMRMNKASTDTLLFHCGYQQNNVKMYRSEFWQIMIYLPLIKMWCMQIICNIGNLQIIQFTRVVYIHKLHECISFVIGHLCKLYNSKHFIHGICAICQFKAFHMMKGCFKSWNHNISLLYTCRLPKVSKKLYRFKQLWNKFQYQYDKFQE